MAVTRPETALEGHLYSIDMRTRIVDLRLPKTGSALYIPSKSINVVARIANKKPLFSEPTLKPKPYTPKPKILNPKPLSGLLRCQAASG